MLMRRGSREQGGQPEVDGRLVGAHITDEGAVGSQQCSCRERDVTEVCGMHQDNVVSDGNALPRQEKRSSRL